MWKHIKERWSGMHADDKTIVRWIGAVFVVWLILVSASAFAGSGANAKEMECVYTHLHHMIIRDMRMQGYDREKAKAQIAVPKNDAEYAHLVALIDEAYDAKDVREWYARYVLSCISGARAGFIRVASSQTLVSPNLMRGYACYVRTDFAQRTINAVRQGKPLPALPGHWSEVEQAHMAAIQAEAIVWPRGAIDFVDYVSSECAK